MKNVLGMNGELVGLKELNSRVAEGWKNETGIVSVKEGAFMYYDSTEMETQESNEYNGEIQEYVKVEYKTLYDELMENVDEMFMEILSYKISENDDTLNAVVRSTSNNTVYIYNIFREESGEIVNKVVSINKSLLQGLFMV